VTRLRSLLARLRRWHSPYLYDWQIEDPELLTPKPAHVRIVSRWPK
jgi:hypothetical protein